MEMNWATLVLLYLLCTEINPAIALMLYGVSVDSELLLYMYGRTNKYCWIESS